MSDEYHLQHMLY